MQVMRKKGNENTESGVLRSGKGACRCHGDEAAAVSYRTALEKTHSTVRRGWGEDGGKRDYSMREGGWL
jgi:hypothetical protein